MKGYVNTSSRGGVNMVTTADTHTTKNKKQKIVYTSKEDGANLESFADIHTEHRE